MNASSFDQAVAAWTAHFEADLDAARTLIEQVRRSGELPDRAKQLGLNLAVTPREYRCRHYDDVRYCPYCALEKGPEADLERKRGLEAELIERIKHVRREEEAARRWMEAVEAEHGEIDRLRRELEEVNARIARRGANPRKRPR